MFLRLSRLIVFAMTIAGSGVLGLSVTETASSETKASPPNVILILADDMGLGDIGALNGGLSRTPHLDQLMAEGLWFNQGYSGSTVCAPARAALLTGRYPHRAGVVTLNVERFPRLTRLYQNQRTLADHFRANGYRTALVGKWHLGEGDDYHPLSRGFDEFRGFKGYQVEGYSNFGFEINGQAMKFEGEYLTDVLTEQALAYVTENQDAPFFLHLAHFAPHRPLEAPPEIVATYLREGLDENTALIYAMVEVMDRGIGRLMERLNELNLRENTLVIFASDNGPDPLTGSRFNGGLTGHKYSVREGGVRVPLIFHWPGRIFPGETSVVAHFTDIVPTLADVCEFDPETIAGERFDGGSLAGVLAQGSGENLPDSRYWQWNRGAPRYSRNAAVRAGEWKLVRSFGDAAAILPTSEAMAGWSVEQKRAAIQATGRAIGEIPETINETPPALYRITEDPAESTDLSEQFPRIYQTLKVKLEDWSREMEFSRNQNRDPN